MLPEIAYQSRVFSVENAAGRGALAPLLDRNKRLEIQKIAQ